MKSEKWLLWMVCAILLLSGFCFPVFADQASTELVVLSTTDMHGKCWETDILTGKKSEQNMLRVSTAVREIREECGLTVKESDRVTVLNPCAFSTPGMTDESNAFLCAEITLDNLDDLNQDGAEGSELFDGFELLDRERAQEIFRTGRDEHGNFYSLAAWMVLSIYLSMF